MKLKLVKNSLAVTQHALVLRTVILTKWRWKNFIGTAPDQFPFFVAAAAFDQSLIHHDIFALTVLDEKHQVAETIEQRLAGEGFGQLRKKSGLELIRCHALVPKF